MLVCLSGMGGLFTSFLLRYSSPEEINSVYGYRTKKAMSDPRLWKFAQKYSAKMFGTIAILNIIIGLFLMMFVTYSNDNYLFFELGWAVLSSVPAFLLTELKLRQMEKTF